MIRKTAWTLFPAIALLSSCAVFKPEPRPESSNLPGRFSLYSEGTMDTTNRWWTSFGIPELDALIDEALTNSPSLQQAVARMAQADAVAAKTRAGRFPSLSYAGSASATRTEGSDETSERYNAGLLASYEVDLWGRVKSATKADRLEYEASREALNTAAITLSSRTALTWAGIIAQRLQLKLIEQQLESNQTTLELIELRFRKGISTALAVYQQRQTVAGTEALIPQRQLIAETQRNELAALLGRADFESLEIVQEALPEIGPLPAIGIPADVLANRPDVRQAGLRLQAAEWQVSAARADRLPAIRLTGSLDYSSSELADLFDNWVANLAASITGPIFDGGRRKAEVARTRAVADERLAAYRETVLNAIKEVENALASEQRQHEYIAKLDRQLEAARTTYEEAVNRYRNGIVEYTDALRQLEILQGLERLRVVAQYDLIRYRIDLYRAMGGTWPAELALN